VKAYRDAQQMRQIPVGYCSGDTSEIYANLRDYLSCGGDNATTIDFFGLNDYSWCDPGSFTTSGYDNLYNGSLGYPLPLFLSETGCNANNRSFDNQIAVLGPQMNQKWSGAVMYYRLGKPGKRMKANSRTDTNGQNKGSNTVLYLILRQPCQGLRRCMESLALQRQ